MSDDERERITQVLLFAGTNWSGQTPDEIIKALDMAGYVIVPKRALRELRNKASEVLAVLGGDPTCTDDHS